MNHRIWSLLFVLTLAAVTGLSLWPHPPRFPAGSWDKLNHFLAFAALAALGSLACRAETARRLQGLWWWLLAWGGLIEAAQALTPGRQAEWNDWLADGMGIFAGMLAGLAVQAARRTRAV